MSNPAFEIRSIPGLRSLPEGMLTTPGMTSILIASGYGALVAIYAEIFQKTKKPFHPAAEAMEWNGFLHALFYP